MTKWLRTRGGALLAMLVVMSLPGSGAAAQTYQCASALAPSTVAIKNRIAQIVSGTDTTATADRNAYQLLPATASKVSLVAQARTCTTAGQNYFAALGVAAPTDSANSVVVLQAGTKRYAVVVPSHREGEFQVVVIFDSKWKVLREVSF